MSRPSPSKATAWWVSLNWSFEMSRAMAVARPGATLRCCWWSLVSHLVAIFGVMSITLPVSPRPRSTRPSLSRRSSASSASSRLSWAPESLACFWPKVP